MYRLSLCSGLVLVWACPASAQPAVYPLSGDSVSNRVNVVVFAEGYRQVEMGKFLADATNTVQALLSKAPFSDYSKWFNARAVAVASVESGSDHPAYGMARNTYFNSTYDLSDRLITIPSGSQGQGKLDTLIAALTPECDLAVLLVNDLVPGGSDGGGKTAIASVGSYSFVVHESGHVLAGLGDEYTTPNPGFPDTEEPNTTRETNRDQVKWKAWISADTPVPTPPLQNYANSIGLFEGANYHQTGWYRPRLDCVMNHMEVPFCEVCAEALVLAIYSKVRPIENYTPQAATLSVVSPQALEFTASLLSAPGSDLKASWFTNGVPVAGANTPAFFLSPTLLGNGTHTLQFRVHDSTSRVRTDPVNLLTQTVSWTLNISIAQLRVDSAMRLPDGRFAFRVAGVAPRGCVIQQSADFIAWESVQTNVLSSGTIWFTNSMADTLGDRFYRAATTQ